MYAISYRGVTGTLYYDGGGIWRGRLCEIPYLAAYSGVNADSCIAAFHAKVDAWLIFSDVEPIPTDGAPEFPGPVEPEPIPE